MHVRANAFTQKLQMNAKDHKLTERMSRSCRLGIFSHLRRKCFFTLGSAWNMARGMALMETQSVSVKLLLTILQSAHNHLTSVPHLSILDFKLAAYCSNVEYDMEKQDQTEKKKMFSITTCGL